MAKLKNNHSGKGFEVLIHSIELTLQRFPNMKIIYGKDAYLVDKLGNNRQIDILIQVNKPDGDANKESYFIAIECKDYRSSKVSIDRMEGYVTKYNNIPEVKQVIVVGKKGFQKGAIKVANHYKIGLYEVPEMDNIGDWLDFSFVQELHLEIQIEIDKIKMESNGKEYNCSNSNSNNIKVLALFTRQEDNFHLLCNLEEFILQEADKKEASLVELAMMIRGIDKVAKTRLEDNIPITINKFQDIYLVIDNELREFFKLTEISILLSLRFQSFERPMIESRYYKPLEATSLPQNAVIADFSLIKKENIYRIVKATNTNYYNFFHINENNELNQIPQIEIDMERRVLKKYDGTEIKISDDIINLIKIQ